MGGRKPSRICGELMKLHLCAALRQDPGHLCSLCYLPLDRIHTASRHDPVRNPRFAEPLPQNPLAVSADVLHPTTESETLTNVPQATPCLSLSSSGERRSLILRP